MSISSIEPIDRTLSGATTPGQSGPGSNSNKKVLHIPQGSRPKASLSGCFVFISRTQVGERWRWRSTPHSPILQHYWNLTIKSRTLIGGGILPLCRDTVGVFYSPIQLGWFCAWQRARIFASKVNLCSQFVERFSTKVFISVILVLCIPFYGPHNGAVLHWCKQ